MYSKFLKKNKALLKESRSFRNSRSLARRKRKVFESSYDINAYSESTLKAAWEHFNEYYPYGYLSDAVLDELGDDIKTQLSELKLIYKGKTFSSLVTIDMKEFFTNYEKDILFFLEPMGTDVYEEIGEILATKGLYDMCEFICDFAVSEMAFDFFVNINPDEFEEDDED